MKEKWGKEEIKRDLIGLYGSIICGYREAFENNKGLAERLIWNKRQCRVWNNIPCNGVELIKSFDLVVGSKELQLPDYVCGDKELEAFVNELCETSDILKCVRELFITTREKLEKFGREVSDEEFKNGCGKVVEEICDCYKCALEAEDRLAEELIEIEFVDYSDVFDLLQLLCPYGYEPELPDYVCDRNSYGEVCEEYYDNYVLNLIERLCKESDIIERLNTIRSELLSK